MKVFKSGNLLTKYLSISFITIHRDIERQIEIFFHRKSKTQEKEADTIVIFLISVKKFDWAINVKLFA